MSDSATTSRGFVFGRPVQPDEFLNRKSELRTILNRVRHGDSSAIVGEPHIGKTSLLLKLAHESTRWAYLGEESRNATVRLLDLHPIGADYAPSAFWNEALEPLAERTDDSALPGLTEQTTKTGHARRALERLFDHLGQGDHRLVLMLDDPGPSVLRSAQVAGNAHRRPGRHHRQSPLGGGDERAWARAA